MNYSWFNRVSQRRIQLAQVVIIVAIVLKVLFLMALQTQSTPNSLKDTPIAKNGGDTPVYLSYHENWIQNGSYQWENQIGKTIYAGRVPHFALPYSLARLLGATPAQAKNVMAIVQIVLLCIAMCLLFRLTLQILGKHPIVFWLALLLILADFVGPHWSRILLPTQPAAALMLIGVYFFWQYLQTFQLNKLVLAGSIVAFAFIIRPFLLLIPFVMVVLLLWPRHRTSLKQRVVRTLAFGLPLVMLLSPWVIRNYLQTGDIIILQVNTRAGYGYTESEMGYRYLVKSFGGSHVFWNPATFGCYFYDHDLPNNPCVYTKADIPEKVIRLTGQSREGFDSLRNRFVDIVSDKAKHAGSPQDIALGEKLRKLGQSYREAAPLDYYFMVPFRIIGHMTIHSGSYYLPQPQTPGWRWVQLGIRLTQSLIYYTALILGLLGLLWFSVRKKQPAAILLLAYPLSVMLVMGFVTHGQNEHRFINFSLYCIPGLVWLGQEAWQFIYHRLLP